MLDEKFISKKLFVIISTKDMINTHVSNFNSLDIFFDKVFLNHISYK